MSFAAADLTEATDPGYERLFQDSLDPVDTCLSPIEGEVPAVLKGFFLITSGGRFSMGSSKFVAAFDVFGKMHRFDFGKEQGKVCYKAQMMPTQVCKKQEIANIGPTPAFYVFVTGNYYSTGKNPKSIKVISFIPQLSVLPGLC